ncbi:hypothetical protein JL09_g2329 [Pichia kudriavzevii]|uniref:CTLH/CRA C-terminal to LisH motif domain-containing protein n=1 Tax=Pichia kudriavzevii TaxID=4909 RepID=A0A099P0W6_PICKU|nr:hypothetical protein JL09_g2329 [Pichia kudriavzevii]
MSATSKPRRDHQMDDNSIRRVNSTPVWPTELPDVFSFSESFFQLQRDLDYSVLQYMIHMGYSNAATLFERELRNDIYEGVTDGIGDEDGFEQGLKRVKSLQGFDTTEVRKSIMQMILQGEIPDVIDAISFLWPNFFEEYEMVKLRLLHLQAVSKVLEYSKANTTGLTKNEIEKREEGFYKEFVQFVQENLSDSRITQSLQFTKDMESTMGLLARVDCGKELEGLPEDMARQIGTPLRERVARTVNHAILRHVDGIPLQPLDADITHPQSLDTQLENLVKLFLYTLKTKTTLSLKKSTSTSTSPSPSPSPSLSSPSSSSSSSSLPPSSSTSQETFIAVARSLN